MLCSRKSKVHVQPAKADVIMIVDFFAHNKISVIEVIQEPLVIVKESKFNFDDADEVGLSLQKTIPNLFVHQESLREE